MFPSKINNIDSLLTLNIQQIASGSSVNSGESDTRYIHISKYFTYAVLSISYNTGTNTFFNWIFTAKLENNLTYKVENVSIYGKVVDIVAIISVYTATTEIYVRVQNYSYRPDFSRGFGFIL